MSSNTTSSLGSASFLNLFGIVISVVFCLLFLILGGQTMKYIKNFAIKIKIIVNRAEDHELQLKQYNYKHRESVHNNPSYQQWETIFKNEIKKSRSLQFKNIFAAYMAKYDHLVYYPFRDKTRDKFDLLKPKINFYTLLVITDCCISWMTTIFLATILQQSYENITTMPNSILVLVTFCIALISSILNIICVNRLFRIYVLNVKNAFKVHYGHKFINVHEGVGEYEPENSYEEKEILKAQGLLHDNSEFDDASVNNINLESLAGQTQRTFRDESQLNSSRKLLIGEDLEKSMLNGNYRTVNLNSVIEEQNEEYENDMNDHIQHHSNQQYLNIQGIKRRQNSISGLEYNNNEGLGGVSMMSKKSKKLKEIMDLQVNIDGLDAANEEEKYIYIEDKHAIGDMDLLENEANKGENKSNITTFVTLFIIISSASAICCYLNYSFPALLAMDVFFMFIGAVIGDLIIFRIIILVILSLLKYCKGKKRGYKKINYKSPQEIKNLLNNAVRDMFVKRRQQREQQKLKKVMNTEDFHSFYQSKQKMDMSGDLYNTQNIFDKMEDTSAIKPYYGNDDTTFRQLYPYEQNDQKDHSNQDDIITKNHSETVIDHKQNLQQQQEEYNDEGIITKDQRILDSSQFNQTQTYMTQVPILKNLQNLIKEKDEEQHENLMDKKQLINELVDYNLLLLRKIFDAYEDRADKVLANFRSDKNHILRKRYMVPILNPNYDYEKLLAEMKQKGQAKDEADEQSVHMEAETVCEEVDKKAIEAINQEASDNLINQKCDRQKIDKYGNEYQEEDNETKKKIMEALLRRLKNGEELTQEELDKLYKLEQERLDQIEKRLKELQKKGFNNLSNEEKLEFVDLNIEKLTIENNRLSRKKNKTEEDLKRQEEIIYEIKKFTYLRLMLLRKLGHKLTKEQLQKLEELEKELFLNEWLNLRQKLNDCDMSKEELQRLIEIINEFDLEDQLTEKEKQNLQELKKKYGLIKERDPIWQRFDELMKKLQDGTITQEEMDELEKLINKYGIIITDKEQQQLDKMKEHFESENINKQEKINEQQENNLEGSQRDMKEKQENVKSNGEQTQINQNENQNSENKSSSEQQQKLNKQEQSLAKQQDESNQQDNQQNDINNSDNINSNNKLEQNTNEESKMKQSLNEKAENKQLQQQNTNNLNQNNNTDEKNVNEIEEKNQSDNDFNFEEVKAHGEGALNNDNQQIMDVLAYLREKLMNGTITEDELQRLQELIDKYDIKLTEEEQDKLKELQEKFNQDQEEYSEAQEIKKLLKRLDNGKLKKPGCIKLREYQKDGKVELTEEQEEKLKDLEKKFGLLTEEEKEKELLEQLKEKLLNGTITQEELLKLQDLNQKYKNLTEEEKQRINEEFKAFGLLSQEDLDKNEIEELRRYLHHGTMDKQDLLRFIELTNKYPTDLTEDEHKKLKDLKIKFGLFTQQDQEKEDLRELRKKLYIDGDLTQDELKKLLNLAKQYGVRFNENERNQIIELKKKYGMLTKKELALLEIENLREKLNEGTMKKQDLLRLLELHNKYPVKFTDDEKKKIKALKIKYGILSQEDKDQELIEQLRKKLKDGSLTKDELLKLRELDQKYSIPYTKEELKKIKYFENKYGLVPQEISDRQLFDKLKKKLPTSELSKDEVKKLRHLKNRYNLPLKPEEEHKLRELEKLHGLLPQEELDKDRIEELRKKLLSDDPLTIEELQDLRDLVKDYKIQLTPEELQRIRELEQMYGFPSQEDLAFDRIKELKDKMWKDTIDEEELNELKDLLKQYGIELQGDDYKKYKQTLERLGLQSEESKIEEKDENYTNLPPIKMIGKSPTKNENLNQVLDDGNTDYQRKQTDMTPKGTIMSDDNFNFEEQVNGDFPDGQQDNQESVYSHQTSEILDQEKVQFMHIENIPNLDNASEDSFSEQDMVYYNKDDLTNYSKGLKLNKIKPTKRIPFRKNRNFSDNDVLSEKNRESSDTDRNRFSNRSKITQKSKQQAAPGPLQNQRNTKTADLSSKRQSIQEETKEQRSKSNNLTSGKRKVAASQPPSKRKQQEDDEFNVEGQVKVDAWNLNYRKKKRKLKKKKVEKKVIDPETLRKMRELSDIYGVDAATMAGINKVSKPMTTATGKKKKGQETDQSQHDSRFQTGMSFTSTQNTFMNKGQTSLDKTKMRQSINDNQSNMFSFNGNITNRGWNDLQSTLGKQKSSYKNNLRKKNPKSKMTATQLQFSQNEMDEESKSEDSNNEQVLGQKIRSQSKNKRDKSRNRDGQNIGRSTDNGLDSHTESDEAVDERGAWFQRNRFPQGNYTQNDFIGGMNDDIINHSESDEGLNSQNPNFTGNDFIFKKRDKNSTNKMKMSHSNSQPLFIKSGKKNQKGNSSNGGMISDYDDLEAQNHNLMNGKQKQNNNKQRQKSESNRSAQKPPLSGQKFSQRQNNQMRNTVQKQESHPNFSDLSDNDRSRGRKRTNNNNSDYESEFLATGYSYLTKKSGQRNMNVNNTTNKKSLQRNRSMERVSEENEHTRLNSRNNRSLTKGNLTDDEDDPNALIIRQQRNYLNHLEEEKNMNNKLAKKRKIKRAAQSQNPRMQKTSSKFDYLQEQRLQRQRLEAEKALFDQEDLEAQIGKSNVKKKKKKIEKSIIRKEINYWLDYDSPYQEYLVARFRQWSPEVQLRSTTQSISSKGMNSKDKLKHIKRAYKVDNNDKVSQKRERTNHASRGGESQRMNATSISLLSAAPNNQNERIIQMADGDQEQLRINHGETMIIDDFEEEP